MADLEVVDLVKEFPARLEPLRILNGLSLEMNAGDNLAVLGPSGSGKSTLLHVVGTLDSPTAGEVTLGGVNPFSLSDKELAHFRNRNIGFIFQEHHLLPQLTVLENVLVPAVAESSASAEDQQRAEDLIQRVGLADRSDHRPAELSGGEKQRVAVARALLNNPDLLLADEPTGSLDHKNAIAVAELLLEMQAAEKSMLIVVTHSETIADLLSKKLRFEDGKLHGG